MLRAISSYVFSRGRLHPGLLDQMRRGGAQAIEIFGAREHFDYNDRSHVRELASWFADNDQKLHSLHSPMHGEPESSRGSAPPLNLVDFDKRRRIEAMDEIKRALEVAEHFPFRYLIQHIGTPNESFSPAKFDAAMTAIEHLRAFAKPLGVMVLIENIPNELSAPDKLAELLHVAHFTDVGLCFDIGHAHIGEGVRVTFESMKPHIRSTHLHDNRQDRDSHLWPGDGTIDWNEAMEMIRSAPHVPPLLLEIEPDEKVNVPKRMTETFNRFEKAGSAAPA